MSTPRTPAPARRAAASTPSPSSLGTGNNTDAAYLEVSAMVGRLASSRLKGGDRDGEAFTPATPRWHSLDPVEWLRESDEDDEDEDDNEDDEDNTDPARR